MEWTEEWMIILVLLFLMCWLLWSLPSKKSQREKDDELFKAVKNFEDNIRSTEVRRHNLIKIKRLLDAGANPNAQPLEDERSYGAGANVNVIDDQGRTILHWTTYLGEPRLVHKLLSAGAVVDPIDFDGCTPLLFVVASGRPIFKRLLFLEIAQQLINAGANVNITDNQGKTILHWAAFLGETKLVRKLLLAGALVDLLDNNRDTPLKLTCYGCYDEIGKELLFLDVAQQLINAGANVNIVDKYGTTILHRAAYLGKPKLVRKLLSAGALVDPLDNSSNTPLLLLTVANNKIGNDELLFLDIAQQLINAGADVNIVDKYGTTILHRAAYLGKPKLVRKLLSAGALVDPLDNRSNTPLLLLTVANNKIGNDELLFLDIAQQLINAGADVNIVDKYGTTILHRAAYLGKPKLVRKLLSAGALVDPLDNRSNTPLLLTVADNRISNDELLFLDIAQQLIFAGANVNTIDNQGKSILHLAAHLGKPKLVRKLLSAGALVDPLDNSSNTPLLLTVANNKIGKELLFLDIAQQLINAGANVNAATRKERLYTTFPR
ncbi:hypothetical protein QAD02_004182 [Eretmocerus hayati]|uniref:Uncharacterized protein n=1 Tax=Eretmocerus hayati TaxID=131215 RepID=A0ACC2NP57_9HYME|nr:hypothetical protein QAD02_004182 [Eretmocerus hayati]